MISYPVTAKRSDMLPIIEAAIRSLFKGENIYHYYLLDNQVSTQIVRFPGIVAAYIPAVLKKNLTQSPQSESEGATLTERH